ncbi:AraC family transcriptional regulator [Congregibacter variabilis]|uniref:AraC family transcriptional regulator n=1 Tax=Congregibacter variabilis TaxID=3081200 RepID=A0ABZ0I7E7_9GAMM|nr:AraC family transcriptional regulator [Congregibacter sp. IMCC43200]
MSAEKKYYLNSEICVPALTIARDLDVDLDAVLTEMAVSREDLDNSQFLISSDKYFLLLEKILQASGDSSLGLKAGRMASFGALGILGLGILSAASYRDSLILGASYAVISGAIGRTGYFESGRRAAFDFDIVPCGAALGRYLIDEQFASIYKYQATILGDDYCVDNGSSVVAEEIHFSYPEPDDAQIYHDFFRCKLVFDAGGNRMWFAQETLDLPLPLANESSFNLCRTQCEQLFSERESPLSIAQEVQRTLLQSSYGFPSLEQMAKTLGLSPRTMRRQLRHAGFSYSELLTRVKSQWADELLSNHELSIDHIAEILGYVETTNFRRAYRRWKGMSPSQYRRQSRY